ncbi:translation initiation factor IF-2 [Ophidiomyces ophidiicola]|nr:translation initiation factor IF-2 [Ophidiomyces ophidiicola]KAI1961598.1 translation initiation factor IF-2 [Ophidiomyces ophidiicola]KAI1974186.1 translation initiation factor IF-2 [Ophidiomyces ophidiicola]KAI2028596.1 translation initiation factor IF-2 [Ophidiomyces ophidiicola]KAI2040255.1 translation initiation factor IF-2 [Ophidiomyces ophidiicola]
MKSSPLRRKVKAEKRPGNPAMIGRKADVVPHMPDYVISGINIGPMRFLIENLSRIGKDGSPMAWSVKRLSAVYHDAEEALRCPDRHSVPFRNCAARIPYSLDTYRSARHFSFTYKLSYGDNGTATRPAISHTVPESPSTLKPAGSTFGFKGGWGKPVFGSKPQLTSYEIKQREEVLSQNAPPAKNPPSRSPLRFSQPPTTQPTAAAPESRISGTSTRQEQKQFRYVALGNTTAQAGHPPTTSSATPSYTEHSNPGSRREWGSFGSRFKRAPASEGFRPWKSVPMQNSSQDSQAAPIYNAVAEREAKFRDNPDNWKFSGFRRVTLGHSSSVIDNADLPQLPSNQPEARASEQKEEASVSSKEDIAEQTHGKIQSHVPETDEETWQAQKKRRKKDRKSVSVRGEHEDDDTPFGRSENSRKDKFDMDEVERKRIREHRKARKLEKEERKKRIRDNARTPIFLPDFISVSNLANALSVRPPLFLKSLKELGFEEATYDHILDAETAALIATEYDFDPIYDTHVEELVAQPIPDDISGWPLRPPVVTIMGHVDHGKTTILDWLRKSSIVASEHGGITQHIGAFSVTMPSGKQITFLDTPGHAAFLEMRKRGADVTDIVILVVAADDSVKPQTIEAIKHAKQANVPIIVAINKVDKPNVKIEAVKQDLAQHSVNVEDYGGDVQAVCVSGKTGQGMLDLEEAASTLAEMLDLRGDKEGNVEGWIVEATTKPAGKVATILVRRGTLRPGDIVVAGTAWSRIRTLKNEAGVEVDEALPGTPVEVDGWREQPLAGSEVLQTSTEQTAKAVVASRLEKEESQQLTTDTNAINEARREKRQQALAAEQARLQNEHGVSPSNNVKSGPKGIPFIIKADVSGSVEAIMNSISALGNNEVYARIIRSGVGQVSEFDIELAFASNGHILSFNQSIDPDKSRLADGFGVKILDHNIIYELINEVKAKLSEHLPPTKIHRVSGEAEIGQTFEITVKGRVKTLIAGCRVNNGVINRAHKVKVLRGKDKTVIYDGLIKSLKNIKKDVPEMRKGTECGLAFDNWTGFEVGDQIQTYEEFFEKRYL